MNSCGVREGRRRNESDELHFIDNKKPVTKASRWLSKATMSKGGNKAKLEAGLPSTTYRHTIWSLKDRSGRAKSVSESPFSLIPVS